MSGVRGGAGADAADAAIRQALGLASSGRVEEAIRNLRSGRNGVLRHPGGQNVLGALSQLPPAASYPATPPKVMLGNSAAFATPISALAAATRRSAAAMSGRRSSKVEGRPAAITGGRGC